MADTESRPNSCSCIRGIRGTRVLGVLGVLGVSGVLEVLGVGKHFENEAFRKQ